MIRPSIPPHLELKPMAAVTPASVESDVSADVAKIKADLATVKADLANIDTKATSWLVAHAHAFVTTSLVLAVLFILHKIL